MATVSTISALQSGYQQLSSVMAKQNADQAEQLAKTLRTQADAAQAIADQENAKAQSLNSQADRAKVDSEDAHLRMNLSNSFLQAGNQLADVLNKTTVNKPATYSPQSSNTTSVTNNIGTNIDTKA